MMERPWGVNRNQAAGRLRPPADGAPASLIAAAVELSLVPGLGTLSQNRVWSAVRDPEEIFQLPPSRLQCFGLSNECVGALRSRRYRKMAQEVLQAAEVSGARCLVRGTAGYPVLLGEIHDPPLVLYALGDPTVADTPAVAVVGTRRPTYYGLQIAEGLAEDLAGRKVTIVSGLARGIDAAAHRGCLRAGGLTIAVLGTGIDVVYPREHSRLHRQIAESGLLLSEFVPGTSPSPQNFPVRNRIISGISLGTVIVEANEYSGSLITARVTIEQNREVFAVPGNITSPQSFGPNFLIRQGAKLVQTWRDVVEELPAEVRHSILSVEHAVPAGTPELALLSDEEAAVLAFLEVHEATQFDVLLHRTSMDISRLSNLLFNLEIRGWIRQLPGNLFVRLIRSGK